MDEAALAEAKAWMHKAWNDLNSAKKLLVGEDCYPASATYHCQQAAEKALKAFLSAMDIAFGKTHDLRVLVATCTEIGPEFELLQDAADLLTPYATEFRYPTGSPDPTRAEALDAVRDAESIVMFVERALK
jgi:HEPN domain-containing protein